MEKKAKSKVDTYSYKGWLNSDRFLKRSFATLGYQMVATLIIYALLFVIVALFGLLAFLISRVF